MMINTPELRFPCSGRTQVRRHRRSAGAPCRWRHRRPHRRRTRHHRRWLVVAARVEPQDVLVARAEAGDEAALGRLMAQINDALAASGVAAVNAGH